MDLAQFWFQGGPAPYQLGNSLRFRGAQSLTRTPGNDGSARSFTASVWLKKSIQGDQNFTILKSMASNDSEWAYFNFGETSGDPDQITCRSKTSGGYAFGGTSRKYRDPAAWMHLVLAIDKTANTATGYVNGLQFGSITTASGWTFNKPVSGDPLNIGNSLQGYLSEFHFVDGTAHDPLTFGEFNADGVWVPKEVTGVTYGVNGFYLPFDDPDNIGADRSGNGNNFTATGFELTNSGATDYDWMADSPTDNYPTGNPLKPSSGTYSEANLTLSTTAGTQIGQGTQLIPPGGKYWIENLLPGGANVGYWGLEDDTTNIVVYGNDGSLRINGNTVNGYSSTYGTTDFTHWAVDVDNNQVQFYISNTGQGVVDCTTYGVDLASGRWRPSFRVLGNGLQKFTFGNRPFRYAPPAGFTPLSTANQPNVAITNPREHFQTVLAPGSQILSPRSEITAQPAAATSFRLNSGNLSWSKDGDGSIMFSNELICGNQQALENKRSVGGSNTPSFNGQDYIEFDPPLTLTGNCFVRWGNTSAGNGSELGPSVRITYGDNTVATSPQLGKTIDYPNSTTTYGNYVISNRYAGIYTLDNTKTLKRIEIPAQMSGRYGSNLQLLVINGSPVIANPQTVDVMDGSLFNNGDIAISTLDRKSGVVTGATATSVTMNSLSDWNGTYTAGEGIYQHLCTTGGLGPFGSGLVWIKDRDNANQHQLVDSVRGGNEACQNPAQTTTAYSAPAGNSVAWCWNLEPGRANGFDIVTYNGTGNAHTIPHNLSQAPEFMIVFNRDRSQNRGVYHVSRGPTRALLLDTNLSEQTATYYWNDTAPTASNFSVGTWNGTNGSGERHVAYLWHSVPGYSAFGTYQGNGSNDGPFVYTGMRPAIVWAKRSNSTGNWVMLDSARDTYNPAEKRLYTDSGAPEATTSPDLDTDFLSNGFKVRNNATNMNISGSTYIYAAFAEFPQGGGNVSPSPAR